MTKMDEATAAPAVGARLDGRVRALREGEVMGAYIDFDRAADRAWTPAEYLVRFGQYVSQRTAEVNNGERLAWRFIGLAGCKPYLTQKQYEAQTSGMQQWYEPLTAAGDERSNVRANRANDGATGA
ncbi:MAG: hypothetical protein IOD11_00025 [Rhodocyclaceae bacterium]|nr:hypothetical protein [Rhodocyclaceae bacterium]MCA3325287.1 hypothetical protein [Roseomonas sp.]